MHFRPCIDIHNGKVKQIVGGSLQDEGGSVQENFVASQDASYFAGIYKRDGLRGGHIIMLNPAESEHYEATKRQALLALKAYPGGLQVGGGITAGNANAFLSEGASHVIVTSYVFSNGKIQYGNLEKLTDTVGKGRLVLDLSCRRRGGGYYIVTDRWQKFTEEKITHSLLDRLMAYADEFLVHAVDVEGKAAGIEEELAALLGDWARIPITYAGGVADFEDLRALKRIGKGRLNVTIGSALDLFGGAIEYRKALAFFNQE